MVRGGASEGGESGIRKGKIPSSIDERTVKAFKGGGGPPVGPGELTIQEGSSIRQRS